MGKHESGTEPAWRSLWYLPEYSNNQHLPTWLTRAAILLFGVLILQTAFIASYVTALHKPNPKNLPVAVIETDTDAQTLLNTLRQQRDDVVKPKTYSSTQEAKKALYNREVYGVVTTGPAGVSMQLASGGSLTVAQILVGEITAAAQQANLPVSTQDIVPLASEDPNGLTAFYLVVGWVVGGYLAATALALLIGTVPGSFQRAMARISALAGYSIISGLVGAAIVGPIIEIWPEHFWALAGVGTLTVFATSLFAAGLQAWLGIVGTGLAILLLIVLGNPSSGGPFSPEFLPSFFRNLHDWLVPGLATDWVRAVVYFDNHDQGTAFWRLILYVLVGAVALVSALVVVKANKKHQNLNHDFNSSQFSSQNQ